MRLDNFISKAFSISRADAKLKIKQAQIIVNGQCVQDKQLKIDPYKDMITFADQPLALLPQRYLILHKPSGFVCARQDSEHPTVLDLIDEPQKTQLQIVGRLDKDTSGLLLLTDDGQWNHQVSSPNKACKKGYCVTLDAPLDGNKAEEAIATFNEGILLHGEKKPTLPAELIITDPYHVKVFIQEGRYHQVKRMFAAIDNRVVELHRESIGELILDSQLAAGKYRSLTPTEVSYFAK